MGKKYDESQAKGLICHWEHRAHSHKLELNMKILKIDWMMSMLVPSHL